MILILIGLVVLINFRTEHKKLLAHPKEALEYDSECIAIHPKFTKLTPNE